MPNIYPPNRLRRRLAQTGAVPVLVVSALGCSSGHVSDSAGMGGDLPTADAGAPGGADLPGSTPPGQPGWSPTAPGRCGDGVVNPAQGERCDDGTPGGGRGCDAQCDVEPGYACPEAGGVCVAAACGDGLRVGDEVCDDGDRASGDGCDTNCQPEWGFLCATPGQPCIVIQCGDGQVQGLEQCDDGNREIGDGCTPFCQREPSCVGGVCKSICGDNIVGSGEACDDGNRRDGDGCSASCTPEAGFQCRSVRSQEPASVLLPVIIRDFRGVDLSGGHPDFQQESVVPELGIVRPQLRGSPSKPVLADGSGSTTTSSAAAFDQWYRDTPGVNMTVVDQLVLNRRAPGTYVFDNGDFFPLDGRGFNGLPANNPLFEAARDNGHNFHFTSEVRYWFEYRGNEVLDFRGDDDVWVFINGHLAVDLGGVHGAMSGSVTLADRAAELGLTRGGIYEAAVFQAERRTAQSSYKLTLTNFLTESSICKGVCGNGIVTTGEQCDDGNRQNNDGCSADCTLEHVVEVL